VVTATYAHIFWTGNAAAAVWREADFLASAMNLPPVTATLDSHLGIYSYIESADLTQESTIITIGLMLEAIWTLYASEKHLNDAHKNGTETIPDKQIDLWRSLLKTTMSLTPLRILLQPPFENIFPYLFLTSYVHSRKDGRTKVAHCSRNSFQCSG